MHPPSVQIGLCMHVEIFTHRVAGSALGIAESAPLILARGAGAGAEGTSVCAAGAALPANMKNFGIASIARRVAADRVNGGESLLALH